MRDRTWLVVWALLALWAGLATPTGRAAAEVVVEEGFEGDLSQWGKAHGRWRLAQGVLSPEPGAGTARLPFKEPRIGGFDLACQVRFSDPQAATRASLTVDRGEGYWLITLLGHGQVSWAFIVAGRPAGLYHGGDTASFPRDTWVGLAVSCREDRLHLQVGERRYLLGPAPGSGGVTLQAAGGVALDTVTMRYDTAERRYLNRQVNGSFEYATNADVPDYWGLANRWTRMLHGLPLPALTREGVQELREKWALDRTAAADGAQSLRIGHPLSAVSAPMWLEPTGDQMISVHLKSDRAHQRVRLAADFEDREATVGELVVEVGTAWQRYELPLPAYPHRTVSLAVTPLEGGSVWIDAVQIEAGSSSSAYGPSWYDAGFALPMHLAQVRPPATYRDKSHAVTCAAAEVHFAAPTLAGSVTKAGQFELSWSVGNGSAALVDGLLTVALEVLDQETQLRTAPLVLTAGATATLTLADWVLPPDVHRCRVTMALVDRGGTVLRQERRFLEIPQPLRVYPEFSHYTTEREARLVVSRTAALAAREELMLELAIVSPLENGAVMVARSFTPTPGAARQVFAFPINTPGWTAQTPYVVRARLKDPEGVPVAQAACDIVTLPARQPDIRVNRINRGLYLDGAPYLPYGVYFTGALPEEPQLRYYRELGFDFLGVLSHRSTVAQVQGFLAQCERVGIHASVTHLSRKYSMASATMARELAAAPALLMFNPVDETGNVSVYEATSQAKYANPHVLCYVNENTAGYQRFSDQLRGFPGEMLSCDRYPLIGQPYGWPQTATDVNGIYSVEERIEWMDRDGERDRLPLHFYLQAAEHTSREPTPAELTWLTYILLANHCLAFTYFDGLPHSQEALAALVRLNGELQTLKPALFSLEEAPLVVGADAQTASDVRILTKRLGDELTLICVNRALYPVDAAVDLAAAGIAADARVEVLFEGRGMTVGPAGRLSDRFEPLQRHVYRVRQAGSRP